MRLVRDSGASYIIASRDSLDNALQIKRQLNGQVRKVLLLDLHPSSSPPTANNGTSMTSGNLGSGEYDSILSLIQQVEEPADLKAVATIDPSDRIAILFSSGTTGKPKAVLKTHSSVVSMLSLRSPGFDFVPLAEDHHVISCHPHFGHVGGIAILLLSLMTGAVACIIDTFSVPKFLQAVNDHSITTVFSVPSYVTQLVRFLQEDSGNRSVLSQLNLSSLEDFMIAGEFMPQEISLTLLRLLPSVKRFRQSFGSTELGFATIVPGGMSNESNVLSSGIPSPGYQIKIMPRRDQDQDQASRIGGEGMIMRRNPLPRNQVGEICAKGPQMTTGYLNNQTANEESFDEDGFFYSGDGGFVDERGFLFVSDRFKEIIKFDGMQVSPAELESILLSHTAVQEAAVIGIPHPVHGHVPRAFVVLKAVTRDPSDSHPLSSTSLAGSDADAAAAGCGDQRSDEAGIPVNGDPQRTTVVGEKRRTTTRTGTGDQSSPNPGVVNELMHFVSNQVSSYKQIRGGIMILPTFQRTVLGKIDRKFLRSNFS